MNEEARENKIENRGPAKTKIVCFFLFVFSSFLFFGNGQFAQAAYSDEIANVDSEIVWQAARDVLNKKGKVSEDGLKMTITSGWFEDEVERRRGLFSFAGKKRYARKYKLKVDLQKDHYSTHVTISGTFRERKYNSDSSETRESAWRRYKPKRPEYDAERDMFHTILLRAPDLSGRPLPPKP